MKQEINVDLINKIDEKKEEFSMPKAFTTYFENQNLLKNNSKKKYKSYTNEDKIYFLNLKKKNDPRKVARNLGISWSTAKSWMSKEESLMQKNLSYSEVLKKMGKMKKIGVGRKISYPQEIEDKLLEFALKEKENCGKISMKNLKAKAISLVRSINNHHFKGSDGWLKKFIKRNHISEEFFIKAQGPLDKLNLNLSLFCQEYNNQKKILCPLSRIIYTDEFVIDFSLLISPQRRLEIKVGLAIEKNGAILLPHFIINNQGIKINKTDSIFNLVSYFCIRNQNDYINSFKMFLEKSIGAGSSETLLIMDKNLMHDNDEIKKYCYENRIRILFLPCGPITQISPLEPIVQKLRMEFLEANERGYMIKTDKVNLSHIAVVFLSCLDFIAKNNPDLILNSFQRLDSMY